jgi:hypothetical protein
MKLHVLITSGVVLVTAFFVCEVQCFAPPLLRSSRGNGNLLEGCFGAPPSTGMGLPSFTFTSTSTTSTTYARRNSPNRNSQKGVSLSLSASALGASALPGGFGIDAAVAVAAMSATAKLLSSIGIGGWAAKRPNLLDDAAVSSLSKLTY